VNLLPFTEGINLLELVGVRKENESFSLYKYSVDLMPFIEKTCHFSLGISFSEIHLV
jgi:hypothetical protein